MNEIPGRSQSVKGDTTSGQKSVSSSPSKSIGFKFNKSKKVDSPNNENSSGTSTPRKKLERLNYRNGIAILEEYKQKCLLKNDKNKINVENNTDNIKVINTNNLNSLGYEIIEIKDMDLKSNLQSNTDNDEDDEDEKSLEEILSDLKQSKEKSKKLYDSNQESPSSDKSKLVIVRKEELEKKPTSTKKKKIIFV